MMRRIAFDSMPAARLAVLRALAAKDDQATVDIARSTGLHRHVAHRHCEDLAAVGVVDNLSGDDDRAHWLLTGGEGDLIRKVINGGEAWHEK